MKRGDNSVLLALTLELNNAVNHFSSKDKQHRSFWIIKRLLMCDQQLRDFIISEYGKETYDNIMKSYSRTNLELRREAKNRKEMQTLKQKQKDEREELRLRLWAEQSGRHLDENMKLKPIETKSYDRFEVEQQLKPYVDAKVITVNYDSKYDVRIFPHNSITQQQKTNIAEIVKRYKGYYNPKYHDYKIALENVECFRIPTEND